MLPPIRTVVRRDGGLYGLERALRRRGFELVAGADEAGRGACAGPLVVAAAILPATKRGEVPGLADSKLLTPLARDRVYDEVVARALAYSVVVIPAAEVDLRGLHVCNLAGMRRALAALTPGPDYVLTDGFGVDGLGVPGLGVWKGDRVAACVAAASVVAKVTRDRIMVRLDEEFPGYGFADHKGYVTEEHSTALHHHGPCTQHRYSYANVAATGHDAVVGSARSRRRSTVSVAAVVSPGGPAGVRRHSAGTVLTGQEQLGRAVASANGREGGTG
jgi:ribonuclease HII